MDMSPSTFVRILTFCTALPVLLSGCVTLLGKPAPDFVETTTGMEFVFVKGGTYQMGDAVDGRKREIPVHTVTLQDFAVGMYEVTFGQYDQFCDETGREKPSDNEWGRGERPVINVSWDDANAFAVWLSAKTGLNFSLPSESQWEYFARAGTTSRYWTGDTLPKNIANCQECGSAFDNRMTAPVGSFKPNPWGLYDTAGNVAEWTLDDLHMSYQNAPADGSAWLAPNSDTKIYRGGAWSYPVTGLSASARDWEKRDAKHHDIGFRLIVTGLPLQAAGK